MFTQRNKKIKEIEETNNLLTGRGGLAIVDRYASNIPWLSDLLSSQNHLKKNKKGVMVADMIYQMILFFKGIGNPFFFSIISDIC